MAFYTAGLGRSTRKLARETGEDVRAEWRPVLLLRGAEIDLEREGDPGPVSVRAEVINEGRGPALNAEASIMSHSTAPTPPALAASPPRTWKQTQLGALPVGRAIAFKVEGLAQDFTYDVSLRYQDLGGRVYETLLRFVDLSPQVGPATWTIPLSKTRVRDLLSEPDEGFPESGA